MWWGPEQSDLTLIFFPCAGGSAFLFRPLFEHLRGHRLVAVDPPGHGFNNSPLLHDIDEMVAAYREALMPTFAEGSYLLVGHSLGAVVAYQLATDLATSQHPPAGLVLCALGGPPHLLERSWSTLSDDDLLEQLDAIGGIPSVFRDNLKDYRAFLPAIRADFAALEAFDGNRIQPIELPLWVIAAEDDQFVTPERAAIWTPYSDRMKLSTLAGGHFFLQESPEAVAEELERIAADR